MIRVSLLLWLLVGWVASGWAASPAELCAAVGQGDLARVRALVEAEPRLVAQVDEDTLQTPLAVAARRGQAEITAYLLAHGAPMNQYGKVDNRELSPLLHAAEAGQSAVLTLLLQRGADVSALDRAQEDALWLAVVNDHPESVRVLIEHGMNPNHAVHAMPPLRYVRLHSLSAPMVRMLVEHGAQDSTDYFYTATPSPYLDAGITGMVPLAPFADWFGARVESAAGGALRITLQNRAVTFTLGQRAAGYGTTGAGTPGKPVTLPTAPLERADSVYLPLVVFIDGLGIVTDWSDRWLQAKLHHPATGEILTVGLADPDAPEAKAVRAVAGDGRYRISEMSCAADVPIELFELEQGRFRESEHVQIHPDTTSFVKCYGLTRYLGVGTYTVTGDKATFSPLAVADTVIGITGGWNAMPRTPHREDPATPLFQQTVRALLQANHLGNNVPVNIEQAFSIDLNGDGRKTVLLSGSYQHEDRQDHAAFAYYSFAGIWSATGETMQQQHLDGQFLTAPTDSYPRESFAGMLDVNGDGAMEIIVAEDNGWGARCVYSSAPAGLVPLANVQWGE